MRRDYHIGQGHLELLSNFVSVLHNTGPLYMLTDQTAISVHAFIFHYLEVIFSLLSHNRDYRFCFRYSMFVYINTSLLYSLLTILFWRKENMETYMARTSLCLWILCTKNDVLLLEAEMLAGAAHTNRQIRTVVWCDAQGESYGTLSLQDPCEPYRPTGGSLWRLKKR